MERESEAVGAEKRTIMIVHTRQQGTLVYGSEKGDGVGKVIAPLNFRGSEWLPKGGEFGDPYWYLPHSRRSRSHSLKLRQAKEGLEAAGFAVEVLRDDTTPAFGFDDLEAERYERAELRAEGYAERADAADATSEGIRARNREKLDRTAGSPIKIGHHSERQHRNLLERVWTSEGKAWELYDLAKELRSKAQAAERFQHRREAVGTTLRRIKKLETRLRDIGRRMDGKVDWLSEERIRELEAKGRPVTRLGRQGESVLVQVGPSEHQKAVLAADVVEITEEIGYWEGVIEASGAEVWTRADFAQGDFATDGSGRWYEVAKVSAKSVSVAGLFSGRDEAVSTVAAADRASRHAPAFRTLSYDKVKGRISGEEARRRFPEAFAESLDGEVPPARPAKKRGVAKLEHSPGAEGENWWFDVGGRRYLASWRHPEGWHSRGPVVTPCRKGGEPVRIYTVEGLSARKPTGDEIKVATPVWFVEEVHNLVRAFVEKLAAEAAAKEGSTD